MGYLFLYTCKKNKLFGEGWGEVGEANHNEFYPIAYI